MSSSTVSLSSARGSEYTVKAFTKFEPLSVVVRSIAASATQLLKVVFSASLAHCLRQ